MTVALRLIFLTALLLLFFGDRANACSCMPRLPPCEAYKETPAIFIALVTSIDPHGKDSFDRGFAHFSVERAYKGITETKIKMSQGTASGDCSVAFEAGARYLIYAVYDNETKQYYTNSCTRSMPLDYAAEDLDYLNGLPGSNEGTRLSGIVIKSDYYDGGSPPPAELISGVAVTARRDDGQRFEAVTDNGGFFKMLNLPSGRYTVNAELPSFLVHDTDKPNVVEVPTSGCASTYFHARTDGRISGILLDVEGQPASGTLVELLPLELVSELESLKSRPFVGRVEDTDSEGRFEFKELRPGRYLLGVNMLREPDARSPFRRTFFPGVASVANAATITLEKGEKLKGFELRMTPRLKVREVRGRVLWEDGRPAAKAVVALKDTSERNGRSLVMAHADDTGRFTLELLEGQVGWLHAGVLVRVERGLDVWEALPMKLKTGQLRRPLKLIVRRKGPGGVEIMR